MSPKLRCHEYLRLLPRAPVASFSVALRLPDSLTVPLGHASLWEASLGFSFLTGLSISKTVKTSSVHLNIRGQARVCSPMIGAQP